MAALATAIKENENNAVESQDKLSFHVEISIFAVKINYIMISYHTSAHT